MYRVSLCVINFTVPQYNLFLIHLHIAGDSSKKKSYRLLLDEFEPVGQVEEYTIGGSSDHKGKISKKQQWRHRWSVGKSKPFTWHYKHGKDYFDSSVLWRVSKQIQTKGYAGTARLAQIDKFHDPQRNSSNADGSYAKKAKREDDMVSSGHGMYRFAFI